MTWLDGLRVIGEMSPTEAAARLRAAGDEDGAQVAEADAAASGAGETFGMLSGLQRRRAALTSAAFLLRYQYTVDAVSDSSTDIDWPPCALSTPPDTPAGGVRIRDRSVVGPRGAWTGGDMTISRSTETFVFGDERVRRLRERTDLADQVESARAQMRDADRVYAMGLSAIRRAADLTQTELARQLGVSQAAVAKTEQRHDLLLSTLRAYLEAIGGHVRIVVTFQGGGEVELDLSQLGSTPSSAQSVTA